MPQKEHPLQILLCAFLCGLFFFSLNKILLNLYYAMHVTWVPALVAAGAAMTNVVLDMMFIHRFKAFGLALATSISSFVQATLFLFILYKSYGFHLYLRSFFLFALRYLGQVVLFMTPFLLLYYGIEWLIQSCLPVMLAYFFIEKIGFWLWVGPLSGIFFFLLWYLRGYFGVRLYFLEK